MKAEIEVKFLEINKEEVKIRLKKLGAKLVKPEFLQKRKTFDFDFKDLKQGEYKWMRVRDEGDKITITLKHLVEENRIDNTKEIELSVDSFENACELLKEMNWTETNYQENFRERWVLDSDVEVTIDTWPLLNPFIEIEAPNEAKVRKAANELGFDFKDAVFGTVDFVYEKVLKLKPSALKDIKVMTFRNKDEVLDLISSKNLSFGG